MLHEKLIVITRKTALEELIERFNTRDQARFYLEQMGVDFSEYEAAHTQYQQAKDALQKAIPSNARAQWIEREFLPTFTFGRDDLIITLGPDGLVVNVAKYLDGQPLVAFNPDFTRIDGVLLPFQVHQASYVLPAATQGHYQIAPVTMARVTLNDGQSLHALNDFFVGAQTHISARYEVLYNGQREAQSSSGIIVTTGAGSTGWWRSILTGASGITQAQSDILIEPKIDSITGRAVDDYRFDWSANELRFAVREPFISKTSGASIVCGALQNEATLQVTSRMPQNGVIFSDGIEEDFLEFNSGAIATIGIADKKLHLVTAVH
ncbi:MAG TPA: hypothetical protein VGB77_04915 [Abditibacteriaceae bacterium]|jgi:NAD kinase